MLILLRDSVPNLIGDSKEEETFCVDTKHLRRNKKQDIRAYCERLYCGYFEYE